MALSLRHGNQGAADRMGITLHSLRWYVKEAKEELRASTIAEAAIKLGWLDMRGHDQ